MIVTVKLLPYRAQYFTFYRPEGVNGPSGSLRFPAFYERPQSSIQFLHQSFLVIAELSVERAGADVDHASSTIGPTDTTQLRFFLHTSPDAPIGHVQLRSSGCW
jgi:hypothetical protein